MLLDDYEEFTEKELKILSRYVTNTKSHVFVLRNLPEVIKGALFSRYSRSSLGLRTLLLKEFITNNEESGFAGITGTDDSFEESSAEQAAAIKKAQSFYDRILDGYGDDSIGELGGAHLAIENISMLGAKIIEDCRIGGSPLEKSTRYIYFDQQVNGKYLFYREPVLMTSAFRDMYENTCDMLFETYSKLIPPLTALIEAKMPQDPNVPKAAYKAALRAKVLDCLRGILPVGTLTNMGMYGNGRFFESCIHKLHCNNLVEIQDLGRKMSEELGKVIPSFIRRADPSHHTHEGYRRFCDAMKGEIKVVTKENTAFPERSMTPGVTLLESDPDATINVAAALLYEHSNKSLQDLRNHCKTLQKEEIERILDAACNARENRRHKSPRALEHATFTFEILSDFGAYRDLHRHRLLTQERQMLSCDYGYYIPEEILGTEMEADYIAAMERGKEVYDAICQELPEEAQYVVPMAYNIRWYFHINLRGLQWLCELRSSPAGHPNYRYIAQEMARQLCERVPEFERFFKFVDYEGYELGRMGQEQRKAEKEESHHALNP
jgi:thymidylate synthase ThyX